MAAMDLHGMTPRGELISESQLVTAATLSQVAKVQDLLNAFDPLFDSIESESAEMSTLTPTMSDAIKAIEGLHKQILLQDRRTNQRIEKMKQALTGKIRNQIMENMRPQIRKKIKAEINLQVSNQVDIQIKDHLPLSLEGQVAESKKQIAAMTLSLNNSEARRKNSILRFPSGCVEALAPVFKTSGTESELFPPNLNTLFLYDLEKSKALVRDYNLLESENREQNFNKFMSFIGIKHNLEIFS